MRIAQISDLHFTRMNWNPLRLCSKRIFGHLNWLLSRAALFESEPLVPLMQEIQKRHVDLVLVGGDLTTTALPTEFRAAEQFLATCTAPVLYIPGNHDCYTKMSERTRRFYRYFANDSTRSPFSLHTDRVELHSLAHGWKLIALDTTRATSPTSSRGLFSPQLEDNLNAILASLSKDDAIIVWNHYPFLSNDTPSRSLERCEALEALITSYPNIRLYLQGHTHRHTIADLRSNGLPVILDSGCPVQKPHHAWNLIHLDRNICTVEAYRWDRAWSVSDTKRFSWPEHPLV